MKKNFLLLAVFVLAPSHALVAQTVKWIKNPANGHYYALTTATMTWLAAQQEAFKHRARLVTIRSKAENDWIVSNLRPHPSARNFGWIGLTDSAKEGTWVWTSGETTTYRNWCPGQPNNAGSAEDYGTFEWCKGTGWNDRAGGQSFFGIMERRGTATFNVFGRGCASTSALPTISSATTPTLGRQFDLRLAGFLPKAQAGLLIFGASNKAWGPNTLPMPLAVLQMHGCILYTSMDRLGGFLTDAQGNYTAKFIVPSSASLEGVKFYGQAVAPDGKANLLGLAMTNACGGTLGS